MKPDKQSGDDPAYPQTYRFRRLSLETKTIPVDIFGRQLAPLVVMASSKTTPKHLQRIFSCSQGLFTYDDKKLFVEKIAGLKDGHVNDNSLFEIPVKDLSSKAFTDDIVYPRKNEVIDEINSIKREKRQARLRINVQEFNRSIRDIEYSTGQYHAKWSDVATVIIKDGTMSVDVFDKHKELCSSNHISKGVVSGVGRQVATYMLYDLREFAKSIRTKEAEVEMDADGTMVLETDEQLRMLFSREKLIAQKNKKEMKMK